MYTVKAATQIQVAPDDDFMSRVADIPCVLQVWKE
jgi:hypothetical protein